MTPQPNNHYNSPTMSKSRPPSICMAAGVGVAIAGFMLLIMSFAYDIKHTLVAIGIIIVGLAVFMADISGRDAP